MAKVEVDGNWPVLKFIVEGDMRIAGKRLAEFREKLIKDPQLAFEWSDGAFHAAAALAVGKEILGALTTDVEGEDKSDKAERILDWVHTRAMRGARHPECSTSVASNWAKTCLTAAYASIIDRTRGIM